MGNKCVERCPISVAIREMQRKTLTRPTSQPSDRHRLESWMVSGVGKQEVSCISAENEKEPSLKNGMAVLGSKQWVQIIECHIAVPGYTIVSTEIWFPPGK